MPYFCLQPLTTTLDLYFSKEESPFNFTLKSHLVVIGLLPMGLRTKVYVVSHQSFKFNVHAIVPFRNALNVFKILSFKKNGNIEREFFFLVIPTTCLVIIESLLKVRWEASSKIDWDTWCNQGELRWRGRVFGKYVPQ